METTKKKNSVFSLELESYRLPLFRDKSYGNKAWVDFGMDNMFPMYLVDLFNQSAVHNAIVNGKVKYITGRGLSVLDGANSVTTKFASKPNKYETMDELFRKVALDYEVHSGFVLKVVRSRFTNKIVEIHHQDWTKFRRAKDKPGKILYSEDWEARGSSVGERKKNYNPEVKTYNLYNPNNRDKVSFIYYMDYRPDITVYPYPDYVGAIPQIETSIEIAKFDLNSVKNGFSGGTLINLMNGVPDLEQQEEVETDLIEKFTGSANGGRIVVNFSDDKEHAADIQQINSNDLAERYASLEARVMDKIFVGHKVVSPMLFGVRTEGQLGGRREILEAYELFKETYSLGRQANLLGVFNNILVSMGGTPSLRVEELKPINPRLPLNDETIVRLLGDDVLRDYIRRNFGVEMSGAEPIQEETSM